MLVLELVLVGEKLGEVGEDVDEGDENHAHDAYGHRENHRVLEPEIERVVGQVVVELVFLDADYGQVEDVDRLGLVARRGRLYRGFGFLLFLTLLGRRRRRLVIIFG